MIVLAWVLISISSENVSPSFPGLTSFWFGCCSSVGSLCPLVKKGANLGSQFTLVFLLSLYLSALGLLLSASSSWGGCRLRYVAARLSTDFRAFLSCLSR